MQTNIRTLKTDVKTQISRPHSRNSKKIERTAHIRLEKCHLLWPWNQHRQILSDCWKISGRSLNLMKYRVWRLQIHDQTLYFPSSIREVGSFPHCKQSVQDALWSYLQNFIFWYPYANITFHQKFTEGLTISLNNMHLSLQLLTSYGFIQQRFFRMQQKPLSPLTNQVNCRDRTPMSFWRKSSFHLFFT